MQFLVSVCDPRQTSPRRGIGAAPRYRCTQQTSFVQYRLGDAVSSQCRLHSVAAVDAVQPLHRVVAKQQQRQPHQLQPPQPVAALVQEKDRLIQFTVVKLAWPSHYGGIVMKRVTGPSKERPSRATRLMNTAFAVPGKGHATRVEQFPKELCVQGAIPFIVQNAKA